MYQFGTVPMYLERQQQIPASLELSRAKMPDSLREFERRPTGASGDPFRDRRIQVSGVCDLWASWPEQMEMTDIWNFVMLVCATIGSLMFGVLAAYGIFRTAFALMRVEPRQPAIAPQPEVARVS
jgi:hypothetical protein